MSDNKSEEALKEVEDILPSLGAIAETYWEELLKRNIPSDLAEDLVRDLHNVLCGGGGASSWF